MGQTFNQPCLPAHEHPWRLALPQSVDRRLEPQGGGLGCRRTRGRSHCSGSSDRACIRDRISKDHKKPLVLHADNGNAMRATTLVSRLEWLGILRSF
jgi:hypothetical protein